MFDIKLMLLSLSTFICYFKVPFAFLLDKLVNLVHLLDKLFHLLLIERNIQDILSQRLFLIFFNRLSFIPFANLLFQYL